MKRIHYLLACGCAVALMTGCAQPPPPLPTVEELRPLVENAATLADAATAASAGDDDVLSELNDLLTKLDTQPGWSDAYKRTLILDRAILLHEKYQEFPRAPEHFAAGYSLEQRNYVPEAYHHYQRAAQLDPTEPKYSAAMGRMALRDRRPQDALAHYGQALALAPESGGWLLEYGLCQYELGDDEGALASFKQTQALMPDYPPVYERMAVVLWRMGDLKESRKMLDTCIAKGGTPRAEFVAKLSEDEAAAGGGSSSATTTTH